MNNVDHPQELRTISLCSGFSGIERGIELTGVKLRTLAHVEIEAYAIANLVSKMESGKLDTSPIWTNLKTLPMAPFRGVVDLLTGGYPCQPFSNAGRRLGTEDPRHLWPWICRIIDGIMPKMCFFENVEGHITLGLRQVLADLEARGYKTTWGIFSASEVGAPHQRKRVFILANTNREGLQGNERTGRTDEEGWQIENGPITERRRFPSGPTERQHPWEAIRTTEPGVGRATNGPSDRVDRLRLLGNGVVPQTAALAFETLRSEI